MSEKRVLPKESDRRIETTGHRVPALITRQDNQVTIQNVNQAQTILNQGQKPKK